MVTRKCREPASAYVQGVDAVGGIFRHLARFEAHDLRGVLNTISMAAYNSRTRISQHAGPKHEADEGRVESFRAVEHKLDRIISATKALDARIQLLVDLVSTASADVVPTLRIFESVVPDLAEPGSIEVRVMQDVAGWHAGLSGVQLLAVLITWVNGLQRHGHGSGGVIELVADHGGDAVLRLSPRKDPPCTTDVLARDASEAFAAVAGSRPPIVRIPLWRNEPM